MAPLAHDLGAARRDRAGREPVAAGPGGPGGAPVDSGAAGFARIRGPGLSV